MPGRLSLDRFHAGRHCSVPNDVAVVARYRYCATQGAIAFCVTFPLMGAPAVMADQITGETHAASAQHPDQDVSPLLLKVEQQIAAGHALVPTSDNALDTWRTVITKTHLGLPETFKVLAAFAARMRDRAQAEKAAERFQVSADFLLFAGLANELLKDGAPPAEPSGGRTAPGDSPPVAATGEKATPTPLPPTQTSLAAAPPAEPPVGRTPTTQEQSVAALYASRGDQMLAIKDISAARRFYEYAANAGSAHASTALARTFDPNFLSELGVIGLKPDPAQAAVWYHKAAELGDRNAETRLQSLSTETAR